MKNISYKKAKDFKPGETVRDLGISFIVKKVRVNAQCGLVAFLDTEDVRHGTYHPDEYFGVGKNCPASMPQLTIGKQQSLPR